MFDSIDQMEAAYPRILPYAVAVLAVFLIYRRFRRSFGRQPIVPARMLIRVGILIVLGCSLLPLALRSREFGAAELIGVAAGAALGVWGWVHTRFQTFNGRMHYVPHTYTGIAVSLLLIGRVVYRLVRLYASRPAGGADSALQGFDAQSMLTSPLTVGLLFAVIGYYVCYYSLVLGKSKHIKPEDLDVP